MLDLLNVQSDSPRSNANRHIGLLLRQLSDLGFDPPPLRQVGGIYGCGTALSVSIPTILNDDDHGFLASVRDCVKAGDPVCLSPIAFGDERNAIECWQQFCEWIKASLAGDGLTATGLATCVPAHRLPIDAYCLIADSVLGSGPRYVFLDSLQMESHCNRLVQAQAEALWTALWRRRGSSRPVMPVYGGYIKSGCPLLAGEVAPSVLPFGGMQVPAGSAWLPIGLRLSRFTDNDGCVNEVRLVSALHLALQLADQLCDLVDWQCPKQIADVVENRRVAFMLSGFGDLIVRSDRNPSDHSSLTWIRGLAKKVRDTLYASSIQLAQRRGPVPALAQPDLVVGWQAGTHRDSWQRRWQSALRKSAVRHRNLVVMSPYCVLPSCQSVDWEFADLLPVIECADAWSFSSTPSFRGWDASRFLQYHRRARAVIQGSHAASFVAGGV